MKGCIMMTDKGKALYCLLVHIISHLRVALTSVSKQVLVHNLAYENEFFVHVHCLGNQIHFHMKGFATGHGLEMAYWKVLSRHLWNMKILGTALHSTTHGLPLLDRFRHIIKVHSFIYSFTQMTSLPFSFFDQLPYYHLHA